MWRGKPGYMAKDKVKLLLNLIASAITALPRGGEIEVGIADSLEKPSFRLRCQGTAARPPPACRYFMILATTPAPTVRPPSRIAKRSPSSIAMGAINSISIEMLSPGITISVPSGSRTVPVTSVVRK